MDATTARKLIQKGVVGAESQTWIDLGAGNGVFTKALGAVLPAGSSVLAIDRNASVLKDIPSSVSGTSIKTLEQDFTGTLYIDSVDGILMANALHFVSDQDVFLQRLLAHLKKTGRIVIVEYDTDVSNQWVPYPLSFASLIARFAPLFSSIEKIGETPSTFGHASIYAAVLLT